MQEKYVQRGISCKYDFTDMEKYCRADLLTSSKIAGFYKTKRKEVFSRNWGQSFIIVRQNYLQPKDPRRVGDAFKSGSGCRRWSGLLNVYAFSKWL